MSDVRKALPPIKLFLKLEEFIILPEEHKLVLGKLKKFADRKVVNLAIAQVGNIKLCILFS